MRLKPLANVTFTPTKKNLYNKEILLAMKKKLKYRTAKFTWYDKPIQILKHVFKFDWLECGNTTDQC